MKRIFLFTISSLLLLSTLAGQDWNVPDDKKGKLSTFQFDSKSREEGQKLYTTNCMSCHGTPGKGNSLKLVPPPPDMNSDLLQKNSDGSLFYKIQTGRGQMPSFKAVFTSDEIWKVISFIRSFNPSYQQLIMPVITSSAYPGAEIRMFLSYSGADTTVILEAKAIKGNESLPVTDAGVRLFVHRTFGMLPVDEEKNTDKSGKAAFRLSSEIPGDTAGNIKVSARFTNEDLFGAVSRDTILKTPFAVNVPGLTAERAMWNNVRKAPYWILFAYGIGLLTALVFIVLVMMKLRDVFIIGDALDKKKPKID